MTLRELIRSLIPLGLMHIEELLDEEVTALAGERYARKAPSVGGRRHGSNPGTVGLAGQRVPIRVPRLRHVAGSEIPLRSYEALQGERAVNDLLLKRVLYGISCRNYEAAAEAIPGAIGLSGSTVSRTFVQASAAKLRELQERDLSDEDVVAVVLDGKTFADATMVIALGITLAGVKRFLGFVETDTENEKVLTPFLRSLVERGLDVSQGILVILDGGKGRCCVNRNWHGTLPTRVGSSPTDHERLWSTKLGHPIEHVARKHRFDLLRCASPASKSIAENRLVPKEGVLHARLAMVSRLLLPPAPPHLGNPSDRAIARPRARSTLGEPGRLGRWHHDLRAMLSRGVVKGDRVVGGVRRHAGHIAVDRPHQRDAGQRVGGRRVGQRLRDDHTRPIHPEMKLSPTARAVPAVFRRRPGEAGERFGCSATDSVHQHAVRGGCMRRSPGDSTNRSLAAF